MDPQTTTTGGGSGSASGDTNGEEVRDDSYRQETVRQHGSGELSAGASSLVAASAREDEDGDLDDDVSSPSLTLGEVRVPASAAASAAASGDGTVETPMPGGEASTPEGLSSRREGLGSAHHHVRLLEDEQPELTTTPTAGHLSSPGILSNEESVTSARGSGGPTAEVTVVVTRGDAAPLPPPPPIPLTQSHMPSSSSTSSTRRRGRKLGSSTSSTGSGNIGQRGRRFLSAQPYTGMEGGSLNGASRVDRRRSGNGSGEDVVVDHHDDDEDDELAGLVVQTVDSSEGAVPTPARGSGDGRSMGSSSRHRAGRLRGSGSAPMIASALHHATAGAAVAHAQAAAAQASSGVGDVQASPAFEPHATAPLSSTTAMAFQKPYPNATYATNHLPTQLSSSSSSKRSARGSRAGASASQGSSAAAVFQSNGGGADAATLLRAIGEFRVHVERTLADMKDQTRRDFDRVLSTMHQESAKRSSLEGRLHSQLLLQSETMVAMELKLLRLEAKVERQEASLLRQRQRQHLFTAGVASAGQLGNASSAAAPSSAPVSQQNATSQTMPPPPASSPPTVDASQDLESLDAASAPPPRVYGGVSSSLLRSASSMSRTIGGPTNIAVVSSAASLASAVSATTFPEGLEDGVEVGVGRGPVDHTHHHHDDDDAPSRLSDDADDDDDDHGDHDGDDDDDDEYDDAATAPYNDGSISTAPTQMSRPQFATLDSILMNPVLISSAPSDLAMSTRATRGDGDSNSSLATSVTSATLTSTVVTATTRGGDSAMGAGGGGGGVRIVSRMTEDGNVTATDDILEREEEEEDARGTDQRPVSVSTSLIIPGTISRIDEVYPEDADSRSNSPLTVQSGTTASVGPLSVTSASVMTSAAVAPARSYHSRKAATAAAAAASQVHSAANAPGTGATLPAAAPSAGLRGVDGSSGGGADTGGTGAAGVPPNGRPIANRVVSFTSNEFFAPVNMSAPEISEAGDSITMPDELDNLSDVADAFAHSARLWREEYEARLDAIQKRWNEKE